MQEKPSVTFPLLALRHLTWWEKSRFSLLSPVISARSLRPWPMAFSQGSIISAHHENDIHDSDGRMPKESTQDWCIHAGLLTMYVSENQKIEISVFHATPWERERCMYGQYFQQSIDQPGMVATPARGQLNRETDRKSCPRSRPRIWSLETYLAVPTRVSLLILCTQAESGS